MYSVDESGILIKRHNAKISTAPKLLSFLLEHASFI